MKDLINVIKGKVKEVVDASPMLCGAISAIVGLLLLKLLLA